jgi:hypothetical protein
MERAVQAGAVAPEVSLIHPKGTGHGWDKSQADDRRGIVLAPFQARQMTTRDVSIRICGDAAWATFAWDFTGTV